MDKEAAVFDREVQAGRGRVERRRGVIHGVTPRHLVVAVAALALRVHTVDLEYQLGGEGVQIVDGRLNRLLALPQQAADSTRAHIQLRPVGPNPDRHLRLPLHGLNAQLDAARLSAQNNRDRTDEHVGHAARLLDDAHVELLSQLIDQQVTLIAQRRRLRDPLLRLRDLYIEQ